MYRIIACKGEIMFNQLVPRRQASMKAYQLSQDGYKIISFKLEQS